MEQEFSSILLENAVTALSRLPGVGRKTALRFALHLLRRPSDEAEALGNAIIGMRTGIRYCLKCHNISENELCPICASPSRNAAVVCVVENVKDVMSIENTRQFTGLYHVLGGLISPVDGVGPDALQIASLVERVKEGGVDEVILATRRDSRSRHYQLLHFPTDIARSPDVKNHSARTRCIGRQRNRVHRRGHSRTLHSFAHSIRALAICNPTISRVQKAFKLTSRHYFHYSYIHVTQLLQCRVCNNCAIKNSHRYTPVNQ